MATSKYRTLYPAIKSDSILKLVYDDGDLRLHGTKYDGTPFLDIHFKYILLTRICPESVRLRLVEELRPSMGLILVDEESRLIPWVADEGLNTRDLHRAKHYLVFLGQEIVDVIALEEPDVLTLDCISSDGSIGSE